MYYLISQFGWYLLAAFIIGLITGWMTYARERGPWGWLPAGLVVAGIAFLLVWFRGVNGVPALWIESALLMFVFYLAGCWLGGILGDAFSSDVPGGKGEWYANQSVGATAAPGATATARSPGHAAETTSVMPRSVPTPPTLANPEPAPMPKVDDEDSHDGSRPLGLVSPRSGRADDLKLIRGIGRQNEGRLHGLGIWHFEQIANWTEDNVLWVGSYLAFPGRIEREGWIAQARDLAAGKDTEFSARARRGEVASSRDDGSLGQSNIMDVPDGTTGKPS